MAAAALLATPCAHADLVPPNPDVRNFAIGAWELWCVIKRPEGVLRDCSLSTLVGWATIRVQVYGNKMNYNIMRSCVAGRAPGADYEYRQGVVVADQPIHQSALWRDFAALYDLPRSAACTGTPPSIGGNFQSETETAIAMLRTVQQLPPAPVGPNR